MIDLLLFSLCTNLKIKNVDFENLINYVENYKIPKFPLSGDDLKEHGYKTGEMIGKKLKSLEEEWVKNNFIMKKKELEKLIIKNNKN